MKKAIVNALIFINFIASSFAQVMPLTTEPDGDNRKAEISEQIGIVKIEISYNRPGVKGREG
jgi:hypothetical protein